MPSDSASVRALDIYRNLPFADRRAVDALLSEDDVRKLKRALAWTSLEADARKSPVDSVTDEPSDQELRYSDWLEDRLAVADDDTGLPGQVLTTSTRASLARLQDERARLAD